MSCIKKKYIGVISVLLIVPFLFMLIASYIVEDNEEYIHKDDLSSSNTNIGMTAVPQDGVVEESFTSHLPLVVLDTNGQDIPIAYEYDMKNEIVIPRKGVDPYATGTVQVLDSGGVNCLSDKPTQKVGMKIKYRGNSSLNHEKKQYKIELLDEEGNETACSFLGMGEDDEWILNISMNDESLIRNYIAYTVANQIDETTPDVRFCEVLIKSGDEYHYEGVYLLMESVSKSKSRVDISTYDVGDSYTSFIVKRDRFDAEAEMLRTYAYKEKLASGYLSVKYPSKDKLDKKAVNYIEEKISAFEKVLYSEDVTVFETYDQYIDVDSFVDYFLLNEFFMNYDAGDNSTYFYCDAGGKIHMGPVWDFDCAMDNNVFATREETVTQDITQIVFHQKPWFDQLCKSERFIKQLKTRYQKLRESVLSDESIENLIDKAVNYLGNARTRDYSRWKKEYEKITLVVYRDSFDAKIDRNMDTYSDEVQRIKDVLYEHGNSMETRIGSLREEETKLYENAHIYAAIIFLLMFLCAVIVVRRK